MGEKPVDLTYGRAVQEGHPIDPIMGAWEHGRIEEAKTGMYHLYKK